MLKKDSLEGQKAYHGGECYAKRKDADMKYKTLEVEEIPTITEMTHREAEARECDNCPTMIQGGGRIYRYMEKTQNGLEPKFVCCNCKKLI